MKRVAMSTVALAVTMLLVVVSIQAQNQGKDKDAADQTAGHDGVGEDRSRRQIGHELIMLPYYGIFDNLGYRVDGETVRLSGQRTRPTLKSAAEDVVKRIEGVSHVDNQIELLPLSSIDDDIRIATYRSIFGKPGLDRYTMQAVPPIHVIVANGKLTPEGVVANEGDRNQAWIYASTVSTVFSVTNNLRVEGDRK